MFVDVPDARLLSVAFGAGPRTVVAIGGWIGPGELWLETLGELAARGLRTVTYDHRGAGASITSGGPIRLPQLVDDLFAVLDAQGVGRCVLAAESMGAGVALEAVLRDPARFDGLVTVGGNWIRPRPGQHDAFIAALRADFARATAGFVERCVPEPGAEALRHWGRRMLERSNAARAVELLECKSELTVEDRLDELRLPLLAMHGELDAIVPPDLSRHLARAVPGARFELLAGLGHVPTVTAPALVAGRVAEFCEALPAA